MIHSHCDDIVYFHLSWFHILLLLYYCNLNQKKEVEIFKLRSLLLQVFIDMWKIMKHWELLMLMQMRLCCTRSFFHYRNKGQVKQITHSEWRGYDLTQMRWTQCVYSGGINKNLKCLYYTSGKPALIPKHIKGFCFRMLLGDLRAQ